MLTKPIHRDPVRILAVLGALASFCGVAHAQQSGLFPLHPIRRERTPCANEDPIYKLYRNQYYGYFPTQWRRFPDGWSLPSSEGPNTKEALRTSPIEAPKGFAGEGEGEDMQAPVPPGGRPPIPNPPQDERSPFEMDRPGDAGAAPGGAAPRRRNLPPRGNTSPPATEPSPFDTPETNPPRVTPSPDAAPPPTAPIPPGVAAPDLTPPASTPPQPPRTSWNRRRPSRGSDPGPLLSMTDATLPPVEESSSWADAVEGTVGAARVSNAADVVPVLAPAAVQQTPSRGPISSFFAGLGLNWLRR
jgi:hypothetical protein